MLKCKLYASVDIVVITLFLSLSSDLEFSLVLQYTSSNTYNCSSLNTQNEGFLIKALIDNTTVVPLHFYYVNGTSSNTKRIPTVTFINSSFLILTYNTNTTYTVPFTVSSAVGPYLHNITINNDLLLNQTVRFAWNQTYKTHSTNCDVWA